MQVNGQALRQSGRLDYKWVVAMVVILGVFMSILDQTIVNIAIPRLQTAFGADIHLVQWVLTGYILTLGIITPTSAYFSEKFGIINATISPHSQPLHSALHCVEYRGAFQY